MESIDPSSAAPAQLPESTTPSVSELHESISAPVPRARWRDSSRWQCGVIAIAIAILSLFTWIRWEGYFGLSAFVVLGALLIGLGVARARETPAWVNESPAIDPLSHPVRFLLLGCLAISLGLVSLRLAWQGNSVAALFAAAQLGMIAPLARREPIGLIRIPFQWFCSLIDGVAAWGSMPVVRTKVTHPSILGWVVPLGIGLMFAIPLIFSHPDLTKNIGAQLQSFVDSLTAWSKHFNFLELLWVVLVAIGALGWMLPMWGAAENSQRLIVPPIMPRNVDGISTLIRNTLIVVIGVFAVFLSYEWYSLWFRTFPEGFYYSGYAHEGAAWLTIALGMSTVVLSVMFSPSIQHDPKIRTLKMLAMAWSACNLLLAIAVYHRMMIYVNFNGMTRMRIVGFVGATCVLVGFLFVIARVLRGHDWRWLIHRHSWALVISIYALSILPMDWLAHRWNVHQVTTRNFPPAVQISVHPITDEGWITLFPLLDSDEPILREGITAMLAQRQLDLEQDEPLRRKSWKSYQASQQMLMNQFDRYHDQLLPYLESESTRRNAILQFKDWAYRWY